MSKVAMVVGAGGQDGKYLIGHLLDKNYKVVAVVRRSSVDNAVRLKEYLNNPLFSLAVGDVTDFGSVLGLVQEYKPDQIYNLAAQSFVKASFDQPALTWDVTAKGCLNVLEAIRLTDKNIRYYYASSSEQFGNKFDIDKDGKAYQDENTTMNPRSPYAIAKLAAFNMTRLYRDSYGIHATAAILMNHESKYRGEEFVTRKITKYIGKFYRHYSHWIQIGNFEKDSGISPDAFDFPKLKLGNLDAFRDWGHSKDYTRAMIMMLERDTPEDFLIATGEAYSVRQFLDFSFAVIGIKDWSPFVEVDPKFFRPAEVPYLRGDATKAREVLGWKPEISFKQLVEEMVTHDIQEA